jgi:NTE family protein
MINFKKIIFCILPFFVSISFAQTTHILSLKYKIKRLPFGLTEKVPKPIPDVALALSGGGARGLAQIGVLQALKDAHIKFDIIAGTSMGSIIGGLYSAGYSIDQIDSITLNTNWDRLLASDRETNRRDLFVDQKITEDKAIFALRLKGLTPILPTSLRGGQKISSFLNLLTFQAPIHVNSSFNELRGKYRAVCTNLVNGNPVILGSGSLSEAMRASSSVSFFLSPVKIDSLILVDGGLVANIPVKIAKNLGGHYVIAVNTTSPLNNEEELSLPWKVADQVVSIPMKKLNESQLKDANAVITPDLGNVSLSDFSNIKSLIQKGYEAALPKINKIKAQIDSCFRKNLNVKEYYIKNVLIDSAASKIEMPLLQKYSTKDSVSNIQILEDLNSLFSTGIYKNLEAKIVQYPSYSTLKIIPELNPTIKNYKVDGVTLISEQSVRSVLSTLVNRLYNPQLVESKLIKLINLYRKQGYSLAEIQKVDFNSKTGILHIILDEGRINKINIEGNKYTTNTVITREIPIDTGNFFNYDKIREGLTNLRSTGLFNEIYLTVNRHNNINILTIHVREKASSLLRVGFRADNENKAQLSLDLVDENLFGSGTELGLLLFGGARNRAYVLEHKSNRIFNTYLTYKINAFYKFNDVYSYVNAPSSSTAKFSRISNGEYRQIYYGASLSLGTQVQRFGNLIFEGKYQQDEIRTLQEVTSLPAGVAAYNILPSKTKIVSISASSTIDTQDRYPYPRKGFYFKGVYESAQTVLGGNIGFTNINFDYKSYFTFDGISTFSPRLMMGFADKTLPLSEQYSLGGQNSFFGMRDNEFRGRQIFLASLEYRYALPFKIFFDTYFKVRYDIGSIWDQQEEIRFKDLRHGIGATLSFDTPIGPADFSVGKSFLFVKDLPGNPISWGDTFFYFSIGYYY